MKRVPWLSSAVFACAAASCQSAGALPQGDLFAPLLADPKEPQFFMNTHALRTDGKGSRNIASVGFGETFNLYRFPGQKEGDGIQVSIAGGQFSQFDLDTPSADLVNTDYIFSVPITYRQGANALRVRLYHQSSHLGDEFVLDPGAPARKNLSYEALELLGSRDARSFRLYAGGDYVFLREPEDLPPIGVHGGAEYRSAAPVFAGAHLIGGVDVKAWEQHEWTTGTSLVFGFEFDSPAMNGHYVRLLFEGYDGFSPYGQFYNEEISYYGIGITFGF